MGVGFGGFLDGIVLHQILRWHHMLTSEGCCPSSTVLGLEDNTLADGFFHVATWIPQVSNLTLQADPAGAALGNEPRQDDDGRPGMEVALGL